MTGRSLYHALRRAGVVLTANGESLEFNSPAGVVTPELRGLVNARKPELLAVVRGDYLRASLALVLTAPDPEQRHAVAAWFDKRIGESGMSREEAERSAYIAMCRALERGNV